MSIERFFIIANRGKDSKQELSRQICEFLKSKGKACEIAFTEVERQNMRGKLRGNLDCLLVLGGDGTAAFRPEKPGIVIGKGGIGRDGQQAGPPAGLAAGFLQQLAFVQPISLPGCLRPCPE